MMNLDGKSPQQLGQPQAEALELSDRWILSRFHQVVRQTNDYLDNYGMGEAAKGLYDFFWGEFCDWYLEIIKSRLREDATSTSRLVAQQTLAYVFDGILKLLHPFMPHITEEIWHTLTQKSDEVLALQPYPELPTSETGEIAAIDPELERHFELLIDTIRTIRNLRAEADVKPGVKVPIILQSESSEERQILEAGQSYIKDLAKVETLTITPALEEELKTTMAGVVGTIQVLMPLAGVVDVDALQAKLQKDLAKVEAEIKSLSGRLANENFVSKARPEVVQGAKDALAEAQKQAEILRDRLNRLATD
jgi:valyl-tRNA synthetase